MTFFAAGVKSESEGNEESVVALKDLQLFDLGSSSFYNYLGT